MGKNKLTRSGTSSGLDNMQSLIDDYNGLYDKTKLEAVRDILKSEMSRSVHHLRNKKPGVYYLSYLFRNYRMDAIIGRDGAVTRRRLKSRNTVFCDIRVGSYRYDNVSGGGLANNINNEETQDLIYMPAEVHEDAYRHALWRLTDARYKEVAEEYYNRKTRELHFIDINRNLPARQKRNGETNWEYARPVNIDEKRWENLMREAGKIASGFKKITNSEFEFFVQHRQDILVNTEGSEILQQSTIFELRAYLWILSSKGEGISQEINIITGDINDLPDDKTFLEAVENRIKLLLKMEKAPILNAYSGPVLLSPGPAGLFFHEVVGHRLEGSRLLSSDEGSTFRDLLGKRIAPGFIDIMDDPTMKTFKERHMIGHYNYDDEGSPSKKAHLVEKGILKNFLTTSAPIPGQSDLNGHARNQNWERPISRMGNLIVINRDPIAQDELRKMFIEEIRNSGKPYGIHIKETLGGETETSSYDFQAFMGEILHAVRVFPDGREELIRGVDFVGTPLSALDAVIAMGDDDNLDNGFCGAESGLIPVSTVSPSLLMRNLELQGQDRDRFSPFNYPPPG